MDVVTYRVISERRGLLWTGTDAEYAYELALMVAVTTARTVYLQEGTTP